VSGKFTSSVRHGWISLSASAMLLSFGVVLTVSTSVVGLGFLWEPDTLWKHDYLSISECAFQSNGRIASLIWVFPARGPAWHNRVALHDFTGNRTAVDLPWPNFHPECLASSADGKQIFLGAGSGEIYTADVSLTRPKLARFATQPEGEVFALACSPDSKHLLSTGFSTLWAWDAPSGALKWQRYDFDVNCLAIDDQSRVALCGMRDGRALEIDLQSGNTIRELIRLKYPLRAISSGPRSRHLACVGADGRAFLLDGQTAGMIWQDETAPRHSGSYRTLCFSPCGELLVSATQDDVRTLAVRNVHTGELLATLRGHEKAVFAARFVSSGRLVSWGADGTIRAWNAHTAAALGVTSLALPAQET
jgi:WD40 repeat protein